MVRTPYVGTKTEARARSDSETAQRPLWDPSLNRCP